MGEKVEKLKAQQSLDVSLTLMKFMAGSPTGMGQLIKYFESQSKQLDLLSLQPVTFNPDFESVIRFKGVPILPPALTSSRRDELLQYKKDAILLEKRLKTRHFQAHKIDQLYSQDQSCSSESVARPTARQLNFDVESSPSVSGSSILQDRLVATNNSSTFALADTVLPLDEFGLQTIDSVSSEFTTLDDSSIPKVFNGLVLTSFKEQQISKNLDRLSKALNVQELTSTSTSDLSDSSAHHNIQPAGRQMASFCHESQDTVVEVYPDNASTLGFIEQSSPGSANTTLDSQRSSPKSQKSAVHFSSFVTEYNARTSHDFDKTTVVTKYITQDIASSIIPFKTYSRQDVNNSSDKENGQTKQIKHHSKKSHKHEQFSNLERSHFSELASTHNCPTSPHDPYLSNRVVPQCNGESSSQEQALLKGADSQASTITSESSSSSTIREDLTKLLKSSTQETTINHEKTCTYYDSLQSSVQETVSSVPDRNSSETVQESTSDKTSDSKTPQRSLTRRGSYTLSEPSPALLQAKSKLETEHQREEAEKQSQIKQLKESSLKSFNSKYCISKGLPTSLTPTVQVSGTSYHSEKEGKAEHISKYLSQVQFQNSMNFSWESCPIESGFMAVNGEDTNTSVLEVLKSVAESQGSLDSMTVEDLLGLHQKQMDLKRKELIRQQQKDMEELFIQQRREVMLLEAEIKAAQQLEKEQQEFIIENAPENIKVRARNRADEYSPNQSIDNDSTSQKQVYQIKKTVEGIKQSLFQAIPSKTLLNQNISIVKNKRNDKEGCKKNNRANSNSLLQNLCDKVTTEVPDTQSSAAQRPLVIRSPLKSAERNFRLAVPPQVDLPEMKVIFDKVSAVAKGFLTRCLFKSDKVQELIKTVHDTREFAFKFQTETPIKKGVFTTQDTALLERIIAQLQAALIDIHEIFFEIPISDRMALIEQTRLRENEKRIKASIESSRESAPKISQATLKAIERKRKAREAEASAMLSTMRPKTAPASTRSHNTSDISGPLKRHFGFLLSRVLKPDHPQVTKLDNRGSERPHTAPEKTLNKPKRITSSSLKPAVSSNVLDSNKESYKEGATYQVQSTSSKSKIKLCAKTAGNLPTKSWK